MVHRIPPLNPLRVFEVVARTENLTAAAQHLHVTQSAVSRQIGVLESYLGVQLFRRERHGVSLTRAGRSYADHILPAFETIADATDSLPQGSRQGALRVRTYTTFAAKWLIPKLGQFRAQHPNIEVRISNGVPDVDFDRDPVDVAIQFGNGRWPHVQTDLLFHDEIEPVCSPAYFKSHAPNARYPESLLRQRLLVSHYRRTDWDVWLQAMDLGEPAQDSEHMTFGSTILCWQAAVEGLGMAMGQTALLATEFASGQLVRPFGRPLRRDPAYYLVRPERQRETRKVQVFRDWLLQASEPTRQGTAGPA
ncbi:transcriptional regulator GcvA [Xylophilus sp.]|uniref:transcriptional regulator GcvA n=1 Tax=Xylophilus sp. TaxID=2653893 RepID=UPI0013BE443F|nr:transcriptional regulator GcvA [Xylophilus sp.]KAF1044213.1 MAG: Glycine cleavage system transcriptional activator [Xylophilus sp.]